MVWSVDKSEVASDVIKPVVSLDDVISFAADVEGNVTSDGVTDIILVGVEFLVRVVTVSVVTKEVEDLGVLPVLNTEDISGPVVETLVVWSSVVAEVCVTGVESVVDKIDKEDDIWEGVVVLMSEVPNYRICMSSFIAIVKKGKKIFDGGSLYYIIWLIVNCSRHREMCCGNP